MDLAEYRRQAIEDNLWDRTSESWKALIPLKDFSHPREDNEMPHQHYLRLRPRFNIPFEVIEQWLHPFYYDVRSVDNYGWLDYDRISFEQTTMTAGELSRLTVLERNRRWVKSREALTPFEGFSCGPQNIAYWREKGLGGPRPLFSTSRH